MKILFIAPFKDFTAKDGGYGKASLSYIDVLESLKKDKVITEIDYINTLDFSDITIDTTKQYDFAFVITHPSTFSNVKLLNKFKYILSKAKKKYLHILWETTPLPQAWKFLWNENSLFDGFFASSYFVTFQLKTVTQKPVYYIPYLIDIPEKSIDIKRKVEIENKFTVLLMGQDTIRKGLDDGITAFNRAFSEIENVQLVIKYHNLNPDQFRTFEDKIITLSQSNSSCKKNNTYILNKEMSNEEVYELYRDSSVLLMPSRGEGFCLPIAEAMSVGLPCIYTDWSAMPEVGESNYNKAIAYHLDESIGMYQYGYEIGSMYAYPSILSTMQALYSMYEIWNKDKKLYYKRSANNIDIIKNKFNVDIIKTCFKNLLNNSDKIAPSNILNINYLKKNQIQHDEIVKRYKERN